LSQSSTYQAEFAPPPEPARGRSFTVAAAAHVLLFIALGLVTRWTTETQVVTAEAELWSAVPQQAAPRLVEPDPPPPEPARPEPPKPAPRPAPQPDPEVTRRDAEIALQKQKDEEKKKAIEKEKAEKLRKEKLEKEKAEKEKAEKDKKLKEQKAREDKAREEKAREEKEREKKKADEQRKAQDAQSKADAARAEALRKENLKRMQGLAGASGGENSTGTALKSSGPSASYAGRLVARIKPNITYPGDVLGNPRAEVEVRVGTDGTIQSRRIVQSSGNKAWDDAVLRAIDKTEVLPRDTDGRVPPVIVLGFRPLD
jgi:colicin import membrane protein